MEASPTIFFLGATGYLGSQLLVTLAREYPNEQFHIVALVRSNVALRSIQLKAIYKNLSIVEATLDDNAVIQAQTSYADIVINAASSDHFPSVRSILAGLEKRSQSKPGPPPLYIHVSGIGILSDNSRGEHVDVANIREYSDVGLSLSDCPPENQHLDLDNAIVAAGTRKENPVRTFIIFPGWIYGVGEGIQKTTLPLRIFWRFSKQLGYVGTWGPGMTSVNNVHVKDVASACVTVLKAGLKGEADEGAEGFYFAVSTQPKVTHRQWASKLGDILHSKGLVEKSGSYTMPKEVYDSFGEYGWSVLGGNQYAKPERLRRLGWEATESAKISVLQALHDEVEAALQHSQDI